MMTLEQVKEALRDRRIMVVAEATGLHYNTVRNVRDFPECNPSADTLRRLSDYFERRAEEEARS